MQALAISVLILCGPVDSPSNACTYSDETGKSNHVEALRVYLLSRSLSRLKNQFQAGKGMVSSQRRMLSSFSEKKNYSFVLIACLHPFQITVDCIEGYPPVSLLLGKHVFLSAGDFYLASRS
jgi:isoleucyl-tRNA synthetase